jgi:hypothetical protein
MLLHLVKPSIPAVHHEARGGTVSSTIAAPARPAVEQRSPAAVPAADHRAGAVRTPATRSYLTGRYAPVPYLSGRQQPTRGLSGRTTLFG